MNNLVIEINKNYCRLSLIAGEGRKGVGGLSFFVFPFGASNFGTKEMAFKENIINNNSILMEKKLKL